MYLKGLEMQGFKSFPEKVRLEFKPGITAVVGPNGSGKSNISDAVRWVLGEQSAKNLRGDKMEDVIFAGTQSRKPLGFAEVSLVLDNQDGGLNIDYIEVTVTRRVYRSGESGFFINGVSCRLKDIHELFMDTGVGREGYSIIGQGKIDAILSAKSEDRRALFEEAAGIVKFKTRKQQAEHKLESVKQNLIRTKDIISEIEKQLIPLEKQAEKTKKYLLLADRLRDIRVSIFVQEFEKAEKDLTKLNSDIEIAAEQQINSIDRQKSLEAERNVIRAEISETEEKMEELISVISSFQSEISQKKNDILLVQQDIEHIKQDNSRLEQETEKNKQKIRDRENEKSVISTRIQGKTLELSLKNQKLKKLTEEFEIINSSVSEVEENIKKYNTAIMAKLSRLTEAKTALQAVQLEYDALMEKREQNIQALGLYESKQHDKKTHLKVLMLSKAENDRQLEETESSLTALDAQMKHIREEISEAEGRKTRISQELGQSKSRYKILSELENEHEGYNNSVKAILKQKKIGAFEGVCGAVGGLISVEAKYETALEIALGGYIQNIITDDESSAKQCINFLKQNKKGRATFLPMTTIKYHDLGGIREQLLAESGVEGVAAELAGYEPKYKNIMFNLLGRVIVADGMDTAVRIARKYGYSFKIVTLDGDVVNAGGSMTGGSVYKKSGGIFSRVREIKELKEQIAGLEADFTQVSGRLDQAELELHNTAKSLEALREMRQESAIKAADINNSINNISSEIEELKVSTEKITVEIDDINLQAAKVCDNIKLNSKEVDLLNADIEQSNLLLTEYNEKIEADRSIKEENVVLINSLKNSINSLEYELKSTKGDIMRLEGEIIEIGKDIFAQNRLIDENKEKINGCKKEIQKRDEALEKLQADLTAALEDSAELNGKKKEMTDRNNKISDDILHCTEALGKIQGETVRLENKRDNVDAFKTRLCDGMWEDYELTYAAALKFNRLERGTAELYAAKNEVKGQISALGSVNVDAVESFAELKQRYEFNIKQREDIIKANEDLKKIISDLAADMEFQFREQFKIIQKNFTAVFSDVFGGGMARLKLADEENPLASGIEIEAQPPGKSLQSLSLLSGGEKTLTAAALLFAILKMKPSPFCILDEIEAALDETNVARYADYLKRFSADNQFILITHKTGTMEAADVLYGVTMEEQGISKIISVRLEDRKAYTD